MDKPIFQNNYLSHIWNKINTLSPSNSPNGERYDFFYSSYDQNFYWAETSFYIDTSIRDIGDKNFCVSGVLKHLYFSVQLSTQNYDLYLIGYKNNPSNVFFILPVKNFIATNQRYYFNFSPTNRTDNLNNVINIQIIDIPIPSFRLNNDFVGFILSNGIIIPITRYQRDIFISATYSLNLIKKTLKICP